MVEVANLKDEWRERRRLVQACSGARSVSRFAALIACLVAGTSAQAVEPILQVGDPDYAAGFIGREQIKQMLGGGVAAVGAGHVCSGTALAGGVVLSAAHCIESSVHQKTVDGYVISFTSGMKHAESTGYRVIQSDGELLTPVNGKVLPASSASTANVLAYIWSDYTQRKPDLALLAYTVERGSIKATSAVLDNGLKPPAEFVPIIKDQPEFAGLKGRYEAFLMGVSNNAAQTDASKIRNSAGVVLAISQMGSHLASGTPVINVVRSETRLLATTPIALSPSPGQPPATGQPPEQPHYHGPYHFSGVLGVTGDSGGGLFSYGSGGQLVLRGVATYGDGDISQYESVAANHDALSAGQRVLGRYAGLTQADAGRYNYFPKFATTQTVFSTFPGIEVVNSQFDINVGQAGFYYLATQGESNHKISVSHGFVIAGLVLNDLTIPSGLKVRGWDPGLQSVRDLALTWQGDTVGFDIPVSELTFDGFTNLDTTGTLTLGFIIVEERSDPGDPVEVPEEGGQTFARSLAAAAADESEATHFTVRWQAERSVTSVPEPGSIALLLAGAAVVVWRRPRLTSPAPASAIQGG